MTQGGFPYAPYVLYIIEKVSGICFQRETEHPMLKITRTKQKGAPRTPSPPSDHSQSPPPAQSPLPPPPPPHPRPHQPHLQSARPHLRRPVGDSPHLPPCA